ncbi:levansucrase [Streptomyces sp. NPDC058662]|uniref:levansucrase n=1 Tax=Streptomyces sp. NPDC058662 TaxID=3346583 RepID=UPI0036541B00
MTQRQDPPGAYLSALSDRLAADGCSTAWTEWEGTPVLVGRRSDMRAMWFGTRVHLFTVAAELPEAGARELADFTGWAMSYAKRNKGGLPVGYGSVISVFRVLAAATVHPDGKAWARADARLLELSVAARPVVVDTRSGEASLYRGKPMHGRMFVKHILAKADAYFG